MVGPDLRTGEGAVVAIDDDIAQSALSGALARHGGRRRGL